MRLGEILDRCEYFACDLNCRQRCRKTRWNPDLDTDVDDFLAGYAGAQRGADPQFEDRRSGRTERARGNHDGLTCFQIE
jgi:hypothetical protein